MARTKGATLEHSNLSNNGDAVVMPNFPESIAYNKSDKALIGKRVIFKLISNASRSVWLDGIQDVINPETKKKERMRLIRGVEKIWMKDQKDLDKEYILKNRISLHFVNSVCILDSIKDATSIEFARLMNSFIENPNKLPGQKRMFFEWNPAEQEKEALEIEELENEVVQLAMSQPYDKLKRHAAFLGGISFLDEMGEPRTEKGIRTLYIRRAKQDPKRFKATLDSKEVEISWLIKRSIQENKIDISQKGRISWAGGGGLITPIPAGRQPAEFLLEFATLSGEENKQFLEILQKTEL
jgi:hypothetical protein